jgi:hypothetical protein
LIFADRLSMPGRHHHPMPSRRRHPLLPALACLALTACGRGELEPCRAKTFNASYPLGKADILFMVDNSPETFRGQAKLVAGFSNLVQALEMHAQTRPDLHIAVVSSDMGAGNTTNGCSGTGQGGVFQASPKILVDGHVCETTLQNGDRFISDSSGFKNYTGNLADVFSCIAPLGEDGCGFEQSLLAVTHALGADHFDTNGVPEPPPQNAGFLRTDAALAIVMLTNEDDCSAPGGAMNELFSETSTSGLSSPLGPGGSYRCNEFGHLCGSPPAPPPRLPPNGDYSATVALQDCVPAEDAGRLIPVRAFQNVIKALKPDPANQILVAAITGVYPLADPTAGYAVSWWPAYGPASTTDHGWPRIKHSCVASDASVADPAVRISTWTRGFGSRGLLESICDDDWEPALTRIGAAIGDMVRPSIDGGSPTPSCP